MSDHPLNAMSAAVLDRATTMLATTGSLASAIREAVIAANEETERSGVSSDDPRFNTHVVNALYVVGRPLVRLEAADAVTG